MLKVCHMKGRLTRVGEKNSLRKETFQKIGRIILRLLLAYIAAAAYMELTAK